MGEWDPVLASDIKWQFIEESLEFQEEMTTSSEKSLLSFFHSEVGRRELKTGTTQGC